MLGACDFRSGANKKKGSSGMLMGKAGEEREDL
jgi:hypothetical protein